MVAYCDFLIREESKSCVACTGWYCTSMGRKKKLGDVDYCRDYRDECPQYLEAYPKPLEEREFMSTDDVKKPVKFMDKVEEATVVEVKPKKKARPKKAKPRKTVKAKVVVVPKVILPPSTDCPYLGPIPEGCHGCCDVWCYARDTPLRSFKHCKSPPSWRVCRFMVEAERQGVKHAGS